MPTLWEVTAHHWTAEDWRALLCMTNHVGMFSMIQMCPVVLSWHSQKWDVSLHCLFQTNPAESSFFFFFFNYLSSVEGIQLPFSLKNMPKDGVGLLWLGANSYCTNLFLIYVVQPNHQGCFFPPHRMWPYRRPASFFLFGCSIQILDRVGKKKKWLEIFDIYLYRTKCLRIKTEGRRHF